MGGENTILYLVKGDTIGGAERIVSDLAAYFKSIFKNIIIISEKEIPINGVKDNVVFYNRRIQKPKLLNSFYQLFYLCVIIIKYRISVVHVFHRIYYPSLLFLKFIFRFRIIYTGVNIFNDKKGFLVKADYYTALSTPIYNNLNKYYKIPESKITLIYHGVKYEPNNKKTNFELSSKMNLAIGYAGRLVKEKGIELLIETLGSLRERDITLIIQGEGEYKNTLLQSIDKLNLHNKVSFKEWNKDISIFFDEIDILVLPSIYDEGFGLVLLEAMAEGKLVIASDRGGIADIVKNNYNGYLFEPTRINELRSILRNISENGIDTVLIQNAYKTAENFNLQSTMDKYEEIYRNIF